MPSYYSDQITITTKKYRTHHKQSAISRKIIAFDEILNCSGDYISAREASRLLGTPRSTIQTWQARSSKISSELEAFFLTPVGSDFLQRNIIAVMKLMKCGPSGIRGMQEYLHSTGLDQFVASSEGALQSFWMRCEMHILAFGEKEERRLVENMQQRKITIGLDEIFRGRRPCLVGIEVVSNYILLEKFTEDRRAKTWLKELRPRLEAVNVEVEQVVSDLGSGICACAKMLKAVHIPELFHAQYEISKAISASLSSQERGAQQALEKVKEKFIQLSKKPQRIVKEVKKRQEAELKAAKEDKDRLEKELNIKSDRRKKVKEAIKELGIIHHPIDLCTGSLQTARGMEERFEQQLDIIKENAKDAQLSESSMDKIERGKKAFQRIVGYLSYFFAFYKLFVNNLNLCMRGERFFNDVVFPLCYLKMIWKRLTKEEKERYQKLRRNLECEFQEALWPEDIKKEWMNRARELGEKFQRSSSCVEGRNGVLSFNHHRFHRLNERTLKVLTIVHNFDVKRENKTTAAERFFEAKHESLFEFLVKAVRIPGKPKKQYHDREKRLQGRQKRLDSSSLAA